MTTPRRIIRGDGAPTMDSTVNREGYDAFAEDYDDTLDEWGYQAPEVAARLLAERLGTGAGGARVLDLGCGTGLSGVALKAAGVGRIDGVDLSPRSLALAAEKGVYDELTEVDLNADPGPDGRRLPFEDDIFDGLVSVGVLTYLDAEPVLREALRVVRPGGPVVVTSRDDLWGDRNYSDLLRRLEADGAARVSAISDPAPYLPGNPDYGDRVRVIYLTLEVPDDGKRATGSRTPSPSARIR